MTRSNIQHDVVQLLDKYKIAEILDAIADIASDDVINEMRKWFDQNFGNKRNVGDDLDEDLTNSIINTMMHEIDHINMRLVKLERGQSPSKSPVQTTEGVPQKILDAIKQKSNLLSEDDIQKILHFFSLENWESSNNVPKEITDAITSWSPQLPLSDEYIRQVARYLRTVEKKDEQKERGEINK